MGLADGTAFENEMQVLKTIKTPHYTEFPNEWREKDCKCADCVRIRAKAKKKNKRLCVFYYRARNWQLHNNKIEWIVCKECQRKIRSGKLSLARIF